MTVNVKNLVCENCEERLVEVGISQLYDMIWKQHPKTKFFNFYFADISDRKEGAMVCNNCGEEIGEEILELFEIQETSEIDHCGYSSEIEPDQELTQCEYCEASFAEAGVFQLWDVDWKWSEAEQRFVFSQAYASELDDYAICCNECGHEIEADLNLQEVEVVGEN